MAQKPSIPKGTRDFSPEEMVRRNFIFDTIKNVFQLYGYLPIETPAMENLSSLLGKYGEEGDRLLFKVLNSGDFLNKLTSEDFSEGANKMSLKICEKGLRYDLTVPFARYVVQNRNDITFPFKRYQVQPVWRADRPQKGRYREFYQCDADIIGSDSLLNEVEFVNMIDQVFSRLNIPVSIKINNRKILAGIAEVIGEKDRFADITVAMDKLEKIGQEKVMEELRERGLGETALAKLAPFLHLKGNNSEKLSSLKGYFKGEGMGEKGILEVQTIFDFLDELTPNNEVEFDITLARGLNYYTGAIFEVKAKEVSMGSVCGGGRYDDLTGIFGLPGVSGVGISFGADRIYDVMEQSGLFPENTTASTRLLFVNFGNKEARYCLKYIAAFRSKGINTELYPDSEKMKKQMGYANKKNIPFVAIVGENEINNNTITLKDMVSGEQQEYTLQELIHKFK